MPDHDSQLDSARPEAPGLGGSPASDTGVWGESFDPPTVRTGSVPGSGMSGSAQSGSSFRRVPGDRPQVKPMPVPGDRIDVFDLEEAIGAGGMGAVFRAVDTRLDRQVALKILPPDQAVDPEVVRRYQQEGRAAARLDHENIARVYTIGEFGGYHFIAFEYIEGTTIRQRVEDDGPLAVGDAVDLTLQIGNALVHAAGRGVVHRDIKPSNIIVTPLGRAKLVDMGLARRFERGGEDTGLTLSGMTLGTFDYISPEQARDPRDVDVRGDLYSLGCTLFHMLSGRPPFPEGTVLQKLLQHQEEPPPDIRKLNPSVPDELAAILVKLMAKDRDRRYQTPEQLVRDLLVVAGPLGVRLPHPEELAWMTPAPAPGWGRHLVWAVPGLSLLLVLTLQVWRGNSAGPAPSVPAKTTRPPVVAGREVVTTPPPALPKPAPLVMDEPPGEIPVDAGDDLLQIMVQAPPRSTILLTEKGPYEVRGGRGHSLLGLDLTIKAEKGVRPMIRLPADPGLDTTNPAALLDFRGGRIAIEGVEFVADPGLPPRPGSDDRADSLAAIRVEDAEVFLTRCSFRRTGGPSSRPRPAALLARSTVRPGGGVAGERTTQLRIDACEFDGGQAGVIATGPVFVSVRDGTFGPAPADLATFWADNPDSASVATVFRLDHASVLVGSGPVFRFQGTSARVQVNFSVFAPPTTSPVAAPATLVAIDTPERLEWHGGENLYARMSLYLRSGGGRAPIRSFEGWADDAPFRESGSVVSNDHPWHETDPLAVLAQNGPDAGHPFRLSLPRWSPVRPGAQHGPLGNLLPPTVQATAPAPKPNLVLSPFEPMPPREANGLAVGPVMPLPKPDPVPQGEVRDRPVDVMVRALEKLGLALRSARLAGLRNDEPGVAAPGGEVPPPLVDPERPVPPVAVAEARMPVKPADLPLVVAPPEDPALIRAVKPFLEALNRTDAGPLTLAATADLELPATRFPGPATCVIKAEKGPTRPRLRFRPDPTALPAPRGWGTWLTVAGGGLQVEGVDLVLILPRLNVIREDNKPWAAFAVGARASLTLIDCTVTIEGADARSAVVAALAQEPIPGPGDPTPPRVRFGNCLLRVGDDLVEVAPGRSLDLDIDNAAIATGGTLVHGHGSATGKAVGPIKVNLNRVSARLAGGLARLESAPGQPDLPVADIKASDTILATADPDKPLFLVDGQGDLDHLRDHIHWEGRGVAYHQIGIILREQIAPPGTGTNFLRRENWEAAVTVTGREEGPIHGDIGFLTEWDPSRSPWTLRPEDLRLGRDSPAAATLGSRLDQIPNPPAGRAP